MDNKTKIKVAIAMAVVVIAVIFILMVVFVKGNNTTKNTNIPTKTGSEVNNQNNDNQNNDEDEGDPITLDGITSLSILDNKLVKIQEDGKYEEIKDFAASASENTFIDYTLDCGKAYVVASSKDDDKKTIIYSIDLLKSKYPEEVVYESDSETYYSDLIVNENQIYYTSKEKNIVQYNINEEVETTLLSEGVRLADGSLAISKSANKLYYIGYENGEASVYSVDLGTLQTEKILNGFSVGYDLLMYKDKYLICNVENTNYLYNLDTKYIFEIGPNANELDHRCEGKITFYKEEFIAYTDGKSVALKDFSGNMLNEELYKVDGTEMKYVVDVAMITENKLQITLSTISESQTLADYAKRVKIIDFEQSVISNGDTLYTKVINVD